MSGTSRRRFAMVVGLVAIAVGLIAALTAPCVAHSGRNPLVRRYREGDRLHYAMKGTNRGRQYQADADATVKKDEAGRFYEDCRWSNYVVDGRAVELAPSRSTQILSLDPAREVAVPNLAAIDPNLVGPMLDLLNFYIDLLLAMKQPGLVEQGSHVVVPHPAPNSWADGRRVLVGEDAIDFDITLTSVDMPARIAVVTVRHVPPADVRVHLAAPWMKPPVVGTTPNNWVQIAKSDAGGYVASVGMETFDVRLEVSLDDGRIVSATMDNPVQILERECTDAALQDCRPPRHYDILRHIDLR